MSYPRILCRQDSVHLTGAGGIRDSILKKVAPELNIQRDTCLASNISKVRHSRQRKEDERLRNYRCTGMTGPLVHADKCEKRNRKGPVHYGETHTPS